MMNDGKIIGTIIAMATDISAKYESIGIQSATSISTGIEFTLKDGTKVDIPIDNWMSYNQTDKDKVAHIITTGTGALFLANDGKYYLPSTPEINDNKNFVFTTAMWQQDTTDTTKYTYTKIHGLNDLNIIPYVVNSDGKAETVGIDTSVADRIVLESTTPFNGRIVINYSSSNGQRLENITVVRSEYIFADVTARDTYFNTGTNYSSLQNGLVILVGDVTSRMIYTWGGDDKPTSYNSALWFNSTALIKGEKGDQGDKINHKWTDTTLQLENVDGSWDSGVDLKGDSAYDIAVSYEAFSGTKIEWLQSLNSCLGKFSSLADLKTAYPSGTDAYKFAIISTTTGQVGIAFYDKTVSNWQVTVFASTNGSSVVTDDKSVGKNTLGNLQINGFEDANSNTIPSKNSSGEITYLGIEKNNTNAFTTIASKEYVDQSVIGGLSIQDSYYDASSNTPDITSISTGEKSFAWIVSVAGTQTLGGNSIIFAQYDLVIKTSTGGYLKIHNGSTSWGSIIGTITDQTDLINKLNEYAKIDDTSTTSAITTYSAKHSLELIDKHRKIFMQSDSPIDMVANDLWIDTTTIPYMLSSYDGTAWASVGASAGTKINDWVASTTYKQGEYVVKDSLLYRCVNANSDSTFVVPNWILISGHMIKDGSNFYPKRTNLQFEGNGINMTDDASNDGTIITVNADVTKIGVETLTNKSLVDSSTKIIDNTDNTKIAQFEVSGINTGTTRTYSLPNKDGIMALLSDITTINDQSSSNYIDIGTIRIQWGTTPAISNIRTVTFPVPFKDTNYSFSNSISQETSNLETNLVRTTLAGNKTTTSFQCYVLNVNTTPATYSSVPISWIAIGLK